MKKTYPSCSSFIVHRSELNKDRQLDDFFGLNNSGEEGRNGNDGFHGRNRKISDSIYASLKVLPKLLSKKERYFIFACLLILAGSIIIIPITSYYHFTVPVPDNGGSIREGILGEPRHINPLLSQSDADRDLVRLVYSGLLKYSDAGKLVPDLAESYEISPDELNYTIYLKEGVRWHDNAPLTADDIIFTVQTAQNIDYGSLQRINWHGVTVEKADSKTVIFKLKNKYAQFLNNLTLPIMPRHLWENIKPINFALSELNLKPIGSGPYKFKKLQKDQAGRIRLYGLAAFENFHNRKPLIDNIELRFYESEDEMIEAYNKNEFENIGFISSDNVKKIKFKQRLEIEEIKMPRYFGVFFNQNQSKILSDKNIRLALAYGTDKQALTDGILGGNGVVVHSPIINSILDIDRQAPKYNFSKETAIETIEKSGWGKTDESGVRVKQDEKLSLKLTTSTWPELVKTAQVLKKQWAELGVELNVEILPTADLQQIIKERSYQMLLFGEILNLDPDPFTLWHSSQKRDPGLNLALYDNKEADTLLDEARKTINPTERMQKYDRFQKLVIEDAPALFLYSPYYLYGHSKKVGGFTNQIIATPADRFNNIEGWHIETKRVWR